MDREKKSDVQKRCREMQRVASEDCGSSVPPTEDTYSKRHRVRNNFAYKQNDPPRKMSNSEIRSESDTRLDHIVKARQEIPKLTERLEKQACEAFTLLDEDGDGVIDLPALEDLLVCWGRVPMDEELLEIMRYGGEGASETGMTYDGFLRYISGQLLNTTDEEELRRCFQVFDSDPPTGMVNLTELRHYLKNTGMMLSDDEIDFLYREEDYWMLEEKNYFEYEELIKKILDMPTCNSKFLGC